MESRPDKPYHTVTVIGKCNVGAGSIENGEWNVDDAAGDGLLALDAVIVKTGDPVLNLVFGFDMSRRKGVAWENGGRGCRPPSTGCSIAMRRMRTRTGEMRLMVCEGRERERESFTEGRPPKKGEK